MHFDDASDEHFEPHDAPEAQVLPCATFQTPVNSHDSTA